jgi:hypothetical protein
MWYRLPNFSPTWRGPFVAGGPAMPVRGRVTSRSPAAHEASEDDAAGPARVLNRVTSAVASGGGGVRTPAATGGAVATVFPQAAQRPDAARVVAPQWGQGIGSGTGARG